MTFMEFMLSGKHFVRLFKTRCSQQLQDMGADAVAQESIP